MKFSSFLAGLEQFIETGNYPEKNIVREDPVSRVVYSCSTFEREVYRSMGSLTVENHRQFYRLLIRNLGILDQSSLRSLDRRSCNILQRNLDQAIELLPESASYISQISVQIPEV